MTTLDQTLASLSTTLKNGPMAVVFAEDDALVSNTIRHLLDTGFIHVILLGTKASSSLALPDTGVSTAIYDVHAKNAVPDAINKVIAASKGRWLHYCYNGEFLFHPFCETRNIVEMLAFHTEERRDAMVTYVVDLYAADLNTHPDGIDMESAMFDASGYYGLQRYRGREDTPLDRQMDIYGGPRWRFEEHVPLRSRKIDRVGLFRAKPGLVMRNDFTFNDEEMNTISCPWHNNITGAIASFRAAKALRKNPGSAPNIDDFRWHGSVKFEWTSQQLLDIGLIEPGQWF